MPRFKLHHLFALSLLVTTLCARPAQAMGVTFDLEDTNRVVSKAATVNVSARGAVTQNPPTQTPGAAVTPAIAPLPIPLEASQPPVRITHSAGALPHNVIASARVLTPPPQSAFPSPRVLHPDSPPRDRTATHRQQAPIGLSFTPAQQATALAPLKPTPTYQTDLPKWIYQGGSKSLVARVIGSAEGTRTASGQPTRAYYGHTDPGNGVWNMGTFSYQHGAHSPEEADNKQLQRLEQQGKQIAHQANQADLNMSLGEILNGLDLANQSPRAALEQGGYVDRLVQAKQQGMQHGDAIVWARTYAYLEPTTQRWNAPGLGNTLSSIRRDQNRRHEAVTKAFDYYRAQRDTAPGPIPQTLTAPALTVIAQPPPTSLPSPSNDIKTSAHAPENTSPQQSQLAPIDFSIARHLTSPNRELLHQHGNQLQPSPPPTDLDLSVSTDQTSAANSAAVQNISETEPSQIHS